MNRKLLPAVAAFLILAILLGSTPITYAVTMATIGPKLEVITIPQDDQKREKGIIILGAHATYAQTDLLSQHKIIVTYNGLPLTWRLGTTDVQVVVTCNFLEKDKVNVVPDPKSGKGRQASWENLMTKLVDVSDVFKCKLRWKSPGNVAGLQESVGVLDVYYTGSTGSAGKYYIADTILVVTAKITLGRTNVFGSDIQDICVLGWGMSDQGVAAGPDFQITKPDGYKHYQWKDPLGPYAGCEDAAIAQRWALGLNFDTGQDSAKPF